MKFKQILLTVSISAVTTLGMIWAYSNFFKNDTSYGGQQAGVTPANYKYAGFSDNGSIPPGAVDFTLPAAAATPTVVHIKTKTNAKQLTNSLPRSQSRNPFTDLFGDDSNDMLNQLFGGRGNIQPEQRASGSGVIISDNGFIVTNNHVVANADEITVTLSNKKVYKAKVIGTDPAYDLAVIKIDASALPYLVYGNSDEVKVGQWVMAIGYPLNLETTVTAGIISAKARSLGLNRDKSGSAGVESYLQTDAAVNMGNSGGALISTDGKLIGVNSAIASPTGYYSGYSYAIPVNIVKKVVDDIIKFGTVQRAYLGINYLPASDMTDDDKKKEGMPLNAYGIYVKDVPTNGGAYDAGIRKGDIVKSIGGVMVESGAEVQEQVSRYKPGDKVPIVYVRNDKENTAIVTLKNNAGNFDIVKNEVTAAGILGAELLNLDPKKAKEFGIPGGVVVKRINDGGVLGQQTRMKDSFIILKVNDKNVNTVADLGTAIGTNKDITISGFYPGYEGMYDYQLSLRDE